MEFLKKELIEPEFIGQDNFDTLLVGWGSLYSPIKETVKLQLRASMNHTKTRIKSD